MYGFDLLNVFRVDHSHGVTLTLKHFRVRLFLDKIPTGVVMICPNCGTEIPEGMAYCPSCSQKVIKHLSEEASALASLEAQSIPVAPKDVSGAPKGVQDTPGVSDALGTSPTTDIPKASAVSGALDISDTSDTAKTVSVSESAQDQKISSEVLPHYDEHSVVVRPVEESESILASSDSRPKTREEKRAMRARLRTMRIALARGIEQHGDPHLHVHDNDLSAKAAPVQPISQVKEVHMFRRQIIMGIILALIILTVLSGLYGAWNSGLIGGVVVPDVRGRNAADATAVLTDAGFTVNLDTAYVDGASGLVVSMTPEPGERQSHGQLITVQVSEPRVIPNVVGKTYREASAELDARGYTTVVVVGVDAVKDSDIVFAVSPDQGTALTASQPVTLTVYRAE